MLTMIGIGLNDEKDITVKGLEAVQAADSIYLESYTSLLQVPTETLEQFYNKKIIRADRNMVEKQAEDTILKDAKTKNTVFLVIGDIFGATTHTDLVSRAKEAGIEVQYIHNTSILTAIGETGLELYKFGKVTSIPFDNHNVETPYKVLAENQKNGTHTLFLLDIKTDLNKFMSVHLAIEYLLRLEEEKKQNLIDEQTLFIGCARLGSKNSIIKAGTAKELQNTDFGKPPHCLIIPGNLHFMEEEFLEQFQQ